MLWNQINNNKWKAIKDELIATIKCDGTTYVLHISKPGQPGDEIELDSFCPKQAMQDAEDLLQRECS